MKSWATQSFPFQSISRFLIAVACLCYRDRKWNSEKSNQWLPALWTWNTCCTGGTLSW